MKRALILLFTAAIMSIGIVTANARANIATPLSDLSDLQKSVLVPEEHFDTFLRSFGWSWHQVARGEMPGGFRDLGELQLACICEDPVLWSQSFLREPTDPDFEEPYNFFDYQKPSIRYQGDIIHQDGAEVGKTREIIAYSLWKAETTKRGSGLIGAPLSVYLLEIVDAFEEQFNASPLLAQTLVRHRKQPYHQFLFSNGFRLDFRPSDFDGAPYRGVHATTFAIKDECAKDKNKKTWTEFWRSLKPGCRARLYSVPDGDRGTEYYRLCVTTPLYENKTADLNPSPSGRGAAGEGGNDSTPVTSFPEADAPPLSLSTSGGQGDGAKTSLDDFNRLGLSLVRFHWPKTLMPSPFWDDARKQKAIKEYGGENSSGYIHNVLGEHGDPEDTVFPVVQFAPCVRDIPEYRTLKVIVTEDGDVSVTGYSYNYQPAQDGGMPAPDEEIILTRASSKDAFFARPEGSQSEFVRLIKSFFVPSPLANYGGADFGYWDDPTEIGVSTVIGKREREIARLHLEHVTYDQQAEALDALDDLYDNAKRTMPWGLDYGNAGTSVGHILFSEKYGRKNYEDRVFGVQFEGVTEAINEDGETLVDAKTGKPIKKTYKELATDLLVQKMQSLESEYAPDPDVMLWYPNHTARNGGKHRIFSKENDHLIDMNRLRILARVCTKEVSHGAFASCANIRGRV